MSKEKEATSSMIETRKDEALATISEARGVLASQWLLPSGIVDRLERARCFVRDYTLDPKIILGQHDEATTQLGETLNAIEQFEEHYCALAAYLRPDYLAGERTAKGQEAYCNPEIMRVALGLVEELLRNSIAMLRVTQ